MVENDLCSTYKSALHSNHGKLSMEAVRKNDQGSFSTIHRFIFYSLPLRRTGKSCDDKTIDLLKVIGDE